MAHYEQGREFDTPGLPFDQLGVTFDGPVPVSTAVEFHLQLLWLIGVEFEEGGGASGDVWLPAPSVIPTQKVGTAVRAHLNMYFDVRGEFIPVPEDDEEVLVLLAGTPEG